MYDSFILNGTRFIKVSKYVYRHDDASTSQLWNALSPYEYLILDKKTNIVKTVITFDSRKWEVN